MSWYSLALISALFASLNSVIQKQALSNKFLNPVTYSIYFQLFISFIYLIIIFYSRDTFVTFSTTDVAHFLLLAFLYGIGNFLVFFTLSKIDASRFVILFSSRALFSFFGFYLFSKVTSSPQALIGILFILMGIIVVNFDGLKVKLSEYDLLAILAGLFYGIANVNDRFLLDRFALYPYLFLAFFLPALTTILIKPKAMFDFSLFHSKKTTSLVLLSVAFYTIGSVIFFYTLKIAPDPSKVLGINMASILITVVVSYIFFEEKENILSKIIVAVFCVIGFFLPDKLSYK